MGDTVKGGKLRGDPVVKQNEYCHICRKMVSKRKTLVHAGQRVCRTHLVRCGQCGRAMLESEAIETMHSSGVMMKLCPKHLKKCFVSKQWAHHYFLIYKRLEDHGMQYIQRKYLTKGKPDANIPKSDVHAKTSTQQEAS